MKKVVLLSTGLVFSSVSQASALYFYEIGTEDTALAGAGQAARAQDASTIVTNPAGMTRLPEHISPVGCRLWAEILITSSIMTVCRARVTL